MAITTSVCTGGTNSHSESSENMNGIATDFVSEGVVGAITNTSGVSPATGAYAVNAQGTPDMTVAVTQGVAYVTGTPTGGNSQTFRVKMDASENVTISANSSGSTKYDWVYIKLDATYMQNPDVSAQSVASLTTSRSTSSSTDDGSPPTYGFLLAVVTVSNGAVSITNSNITDKRNRNDLISLDSNGNSSMVPAKPNKLVKTSVLRQDNTTNTYQSGNTVILTGYGVGVPGAAAFLSEAVTFGITFAAAPIVTISYGGDDTGASTTYGAGGNERKTYVVATAHTVTTTGFTARVSTTDATNWTAGDTVFYQWIAIGEIA